MVATVTITESGTGNVTFNNTVDSETGEANNLHVNTTTGAAIFAGIVGNDALGALSNDNGLGTLETDAAQINTTLVRTTGTQTYQGAVTLGAVDVTLQSGTTVTFNSTVDASTLGTEGLVIAVHDVLATGGNAVIGDGGADHIGGTIAPRIVTVAGTTSFNVVIDTATPGSFLDSVETTGLQTYTGVVTLAEHTTLSSTGAGSITFGGNITSPTTAYDLIVNTQGNTAFNGATVGTMAEPLRLLITDDPNQVLGDAVKTGGAGTTTINGTFFIQNDQEHWDPVILGSDVQINAVAAEFFSSLNGIGTGTESLDVNGNARFGDSLDIAGAADVTADRVGATGGLEFIDVSGNTIIDTDQITTSGVGLDADDGDQTYGDDATMDTVTINTGTTLAGADVTFNSAVDSEGGENNDLTVNTTSHAGSMGLTTFNGQVGAAQALGNLETNADGTTVLNLTGGGATGGLVVTTGNQTYFDNVLIGDPDGVAVDNSTPANLLNEALAEADAGFNDSRATLRSTGAGAIRFGARVDGDGVAGEANLLVETAGITRFDGLVGDTTPLTTLETDGTGTDVVGENTIINPEGGVSGTMADSNVTTDGFQTYHDNVVLAQNLGDDNELDVYVKVTTAAAEITFVNRIDGRTHSSMNPTPMNATETDDYEHGLTVFTDQSSVDQTKVGIIVPLEFLDISDGPSGANMQTLTLSMDTEIRAGVVILGFVETGGFDLIITANDIDFTAGPGSVMSGSPTDDLILRPIEASAVINGPGMHPVINIGVTVDVPGTFSLSDDDLAAIADGFQSITIGRFDGENNINVESSIFTDPVRIQSPVGGTISGIGNIDSTATAAEAMAAATPFVNDVDENNVPIPGGVDGFGLGAGVVPPSGNGAGVLVIGSQATSMWGANITTTGTPIQFTDTVVFVGNSILDTTSGAATGADVIFNNTVNDSVANEHSVLIIAGTGDVDFRDSVGATLPLRGITIESADDVDIDSTFAVGRFVQSAGTGSTVLRGDVTISATGATTGINLTTATIVIGDDGDSSMADATPQFSGDGTANGVTLTSNGDLVRLNGAVSLVGGDNTITAGAGAITFESTIDGAQNLDLNATGVTTLRGAVGGTTPLTSLDTDAGGGTAVDGGGVTTTAAQTYGDNVTVGVLDATFAGVTITFSGTVDGAQAVTVNDSGTTTFAMTVGATTPLTSLLTDAAGTTAVNGDSVRTSGTQTYNDNVTFDGGTGFTGTTVTFNEDATGAGNTLTVTGDAVFGDAADDAITSSTLLVTGTTLVNAATVTTAGATQTYNGDVTLGSGVNFTGSTVNFDEDVAGANTLTVTGDAVFGNAADDAVNTSTILVTGATTVNGATVTSTGTTQTYNGDVTLATGVNFTGTTVSFDEDILGGANILTITGDAVLGDAADDAVTSGTLLVTGASTVNAGTVTTAGATQTYNGNVTLGSGVNFTGTTVSFDEDIIGGANTLTVTGNAVFGDAADDAFASGTLLVTGTTLVNGATVTTAGATQTYNGDVTLGTGVNFTGTTVTFDEDIIGNGNTLTVTGDAVLGNAADDSVSSGTLLVTGASTVNGATVTTFGATQTYNGDVTLGTGVNFTGSTVNFDEDIIGGANTLTVTGDAVFGDATDDAIASGTLLVTGATTVNAATVTTAGATQTYNGNVTLGSGVNFTGTTVNFDEDIIGGANTLTITGDAVFGTGADDAVASGTLLVTGASTVNAATVTTAGATQTYNGNVTLGSGVNFTGTTVNFDEDIIGGANTLTITGDAVLGDAADDAIASGTLLVTGATTVNAATVTTAGATQTYNGDVTLGSGVNFTGTTVQFDEDIIGGENTLTITGDAVFGDAADDAIASGTLLVTGASTVNAATVTTAGATQTYNGDVTLGSGVNFTGSTVNFDEDVAGANTLTVTGDAVFGNAADDAVNTSTILVTGATTVNGATVTSTGTTQTYNGDVTLATGVNFTGTTVSFDEDILGGANILTITGDAVLGDAADDAVTSGTLLVTGASTVNAGTVTTAGATQTYNGNVTLGSGVNFTGTTVSFDEDIIGGANTLTVTGNAVFGDAADDAFASGTLLVTGTTLVNGATVTTAGRDPNLQWRRHAWHGRQLHGHDSHL